MQANGVLQLEWDTVPLGPTCYRLYSMQENGQAVFVDSFDQGPFDTALEVAQWLIRAVAKQVRPSRL